VGHGPEQQTVGISTAAPAAYWIIRNNIIVGAGTGLYLGGSDGAAPFVAGVIEGNVIVGTTGYNLQIKHQNPRPLLPGMPDGALRTTLRGNVFAKTATSSTGSMARPNLLLGHFPLRGPGQDDEYRVEQNVFYGNPTEALMQAEGNVVVEGNLLMNPFGDGLVIQPHKDVPRRVAVLGNFAAVSGSGIHVVGVDPGHPQVVSRNEIVPYASFTAHTTHEAGDVLKSPLARWLGEREAAEARRTALLRALRVACAPLSLERAGVPPIGIIPGDAPVCMDSLLGQTRRRGK
jgi:hypothetical protein